MFTPLLTFTESAVLMIIYLFFIADIQSVQIELMKNIFSEAGEIQVCALLDFPLFDLCSNNISFTVDLFVLQISGQ